MLDLVCFREVLTAALEFTVVILMPGTVPKA